MTRLVALLDLLALDLEAYVERLAAELCPGAYSPTGVERFTTARRRAALAAAAAGLIPSTTQLQQGEL